MRTRNRFLNISYLTNTLALKSRAFMLRLKRGPYPYSFFKNRTTPLSEVEYDLSFQTEYISLSYFNHKKAMEMHAKNCSITQELIIALAYHNECLKDPELDKSEILTLASSILSKATISDTEMIFYLNEPYAKFDLKGKYFSGIVQGKAASFFLRCYVFSKDEKFKLYAKKCLLTCWKLKENGGTLIDLPHNNVWIEEYPSPKPSMVLNGFLFYIIGLAEYLTIDNNKEMEKKLKICLQSTMSWIPHYRLEKGILYSMYRWNLCNVHYTGIMSYQFEHLHKLTNIKLFNEYKEFTSDLTNWSTFETIM